MSKRTYERTNEDLLQAARPIWHNTRSLQHISSETERRTDTDKEHKAETDEQPHKSKTRQITIWNTLQQQTA